MSERWVPGKKLPGKLSDPKWLQLHSNHHHLLDPRPNIADMFRPKPARAPQTRQNLSDLIKDKTKKLNLTSHVAGSGFISDGLGKVNQYLKSILYGKKRKTPSSSGSIQVIKGGKALNPNGVKRIRFRGKYILYA